MKRTEQPFDETSLSLELQNSFETEGVLWTKTNVELLIRRNLFLNDVQLKEKYDCFGDRVGQYLDIDYVSSVGEFPAYIESIGLKELENIDGYSFVLKDYCKEYPVLFCVLYVDDWNNVYWRVGLPEDADNIVKVCEYYSHFPGEYHGKVQFGLNWKPIKVEEWYDFDCEKDNREIERLKHQLSLLWKQL